MGFSGKLERSNFLELPFSLNLTERERVIALLHQNAGSKKMGICHPKSYSAEFRNFIKISGLHCAYIYLNVIGASNKRFIDQ